MSQKLAVVVTGGTGKQGGAVVKSLLERGHEVRAVARSTDSAKAREFSRDARDPASGAHCRRGCAMLLDAIRQFAITLGDR
jgi:nucleoside-diphosphate-sugar epimerase